VLAGTAFAKWSRFSQFAGIAIRMQRSALVINSKRLASIRTGTSGLLRCTSTIRPYFFNIWSHLVQFRGSTSSFFVHADAGET
jgi:hypothetical protein